MLTSMTNRKKRLRKGVESLEKQITLHAAKLQKAEKEDNIELARYYIKELEAKKKDKDKKQKMLDKGG